LGNISKRLSNINLFIILNSFDLCPPKYQAMKCATQAKPNSSNAARLQKISLNKKTGYTMQPVFASEQQYCY